MEDLRRRVYPNEMREFFRQAQEERRQADAIRTLQPVNQQIRQDFKRAQLKTLSEGLLQRTDPDKNSPIQVLNPDLLRKIGTFL
jgi:hypothetical protein